MSTTFNIYSKQLVINDSFEIYRTLHNLTHEEAERVKRSFINTYSTYATIERFIASGFDDGKKLILEAVRKITQGLEVQTVSISEREFLFRYYNLDSLWGNTYQNIRQEVEVLRSRKRDYDRELNDALSEQRQAEQQVNSAERALRDGETKLTLAINQNRRAIEDEQRDEEWKNMDRIVTTL